MRLTITRLRARVLLGIYDWEQQRPRDVSLTLHIDFDGKATASDQIADCIEYEALSRRILTQIEGRPYALIERMVEDVLDIIGAHPAAEQAEVCIEKPGAIPTAASVSITSKRTYRA